VVAKPASEEVLTLEQAAALLHLHPRTVSALARAGKLPGRKVGKQWRFARARLVEHVADPTRIPGPPQR
jgi:excisionase family DNA binding protein